MLEAQKVSGTTSDVFGQPGVCLGQSGVCSGSLSNRQSTKTEAASTGLQTTWLKRTIEKTLLDKF